MAESPAREAATALQLCMSCAQSKPRKQVVKELSLKELLQCFNLPRKVGSAEVASGPGEAGGSLREPAVVPVELKTSISESTRYDLGQPKWMPILHSMYRLVIQCIIQYTCTRIGLVIQNFSSAFKS